MRSNLMKISLPACLLFILVLAGCCTDPTYGPVAEFRRKHPEEAKRFSALYPTSLSAYGILLGDRMAQFNAVLAGMKQRFGDTPGLKDYADQSAAELGGQARHALDHFSDLVAKSSNGGALCEYEWSDGKIKETGLLILKGGEVIEKESWLTENLLPAL
jgi:hypothetical protein